MRYNRFIAIFAIAATFAFVGCSENTPEATAKKFLNAFYHMEYEKARQVSTEKTIQLVNLWEQFSLQYPDSAKQNAKKIKVEILNVQEDGDNAVATYTVSTEPGEQKLKLTKQNGKWLVNDSKQDTAYEEEEEQAAEPTPVITDTASKPAE